jgi:hypothetical protein
MGIAAYRSDTLTIFIVTEILAFNEVMEALMAFYEKDQPTENVMWDASQVNHADLSDERFNKLISYEQGHIHSRPRGKTALVASSDLLYELAKMAEVLASKTKLPHKFEVFRSTREALHWLKNE